jgi:hypothetical protein
MSAVEAGLEVEEDGVGMRMGDLDLIVVVKLGFGGRNQSETIIAVPRSHPRETTEFFRRWSGGRIEAAINHG